MNTLVKLGLSLVLCGTFVMARAQAPSTDLEAQAQVLKLEFLTGVWKGEGWMMGRNGEKHKFRQMERVQFKLDSTALLVEGRGVAGGKITHDALAVITYDAKNENYNFQSFLFTGKQGKFEAELRDSKFVWHVSDDRRFTIEVNAEGQWHEIGEFNRDGTWSQFFEMTLERQSSDVQE